MKSNAHNAGAIGSVFTAQARGGKAAEPWPYYQSLINGVESKPTLDAVNPFPAARSQSLTAHEINPRS